MQVRCFTTLNELASYADQWDELAAGVPFRSWTWLSKWWRHYGPQSGVNQRPGYLSVLCVIDDAGVLQGVAPWYLDCSATRGRVLRPLGSGEVCSDYLSVLSRSATREAVIAALADYLVANAYDHGPDALRWDLLQLEGVDDGDSSVVALVNHLEAAGCTVHRRARVSCWRLMLPGDWESYLASLGKNLRRDMRRLERELLDTGRASLHAVTRPDELPQAMEILVDLHQRRRNALGEKGCFSSQPFLDFYRDVVPTMFAHGQVQFYWLELDGHPVAAEYQLVGKDVLYAYQAGLDPTAVKHQPGKLIYLAILRHAIDHGYRAFDFLRGDEPYKARFGAQPRSSAELRVVPRRAVAKLRHNFWMASTSVKEWIKRGVRGQRREEAASEDEEKPTCDEAPASNRLISPPNP